MSISPAKLALLKAMARLAVEAHLTQQSKAIAANQPERTNHVALLSSHKAA